MANRQARRAREVARRAQETRMRQLLRKNKKSRHCDLSAAERRALARVVYVWSALWPRYRNPRTRSICRFYQWLHRQPIVGKPAVYARPEDLLADLLRHRAGRLLLLYRQPHLKQLLRHGQVMRDLQKWTPHRGQNLDLMLAQLVEEWMGAYRHQLPPVIREHLRWSINRLGRPELTTTWKFFLEQLAGHPVHRSAHLPDDWALPASAQFAMRRVPKSIYSLEAILEAAYLLDRGVPRTHVREVVGYQPFSMKSDAFWVKTRFWQWLGKNAGCSVEQAMRDFWVAMSWYDHLLANQVDMRPEHAYEILEVYLLEQRANPFTELVEEVWFAFGVREAARMGRSFRLRGRNRKKLLQRYQIFYLQFVAELAGAEPEWAGASLPEWTGQGSDGPYRIVQLRSASALKLEGLLLRHCVGGYDTVCRQGVSSIWSLRRCEKGKPEQPVVTIELNRKGKIMQAYGRNNTQPKSEWLVMIEAWRNSWKKRTATSVQV